MTPEEIRELLDKVERKEAKERKELRERLRRQEKEQRAFVKKAVSGKTDTEPIADARPTESTNVELSPVEGDSKEVLKDRLRLCKQVAKEEVEVSQKRLLQIQRLVSQLRHDLNALTTYGVASSSVPSHFLNLVPKLRQMRARGVLVDEVQEEIHRVTKRISSRAEAIVAGEKAALKRKRRTLSHFTVTLFGRTMAGKSTFREAVTGGNGDTIGKGAQRTTRDVRFYDWNGLRIVDTPGIGAFKGKVDKRKAFSIVGETDLILYLTTTDGVQETSFKALKALRDRGKSILFVLNVKRDLSKSKVYRRRFIENPDNMIGQGATKGYRERIRELGRKHLGMDCPVIYAIHAQAAHLATQSEYEEIAEQLHIASGIDRLFDGLTNELIQRGAQRRVQTVTGGTARGIEKLVQFLDTEKQSLRSQAEYLQKKHQDLKRRLDRHQKRVERKRIPTLVAELLQPLRDQVSSFIDDNIQHEDVAERWQQRVAALDLEKNLQSEQQQLVDEVKSLLETFADEIEAEAEVISPTLDGPQSYNPIDIKKALVWTFHISVFLSSVFTIVIAANIWNPIGWTLIVVGNLALLSSFAVKDKSDKIHNYKKDAAIELRKSIDEMDSNICHNLKEWYTNTLMSRVRSLTLYNIELHYEFLRSVADRLEITETEARRIEKELREHISRRTSKLAS